MMGSINRYEFRFLDLLMLNIRKKFVDREEAYALYTKYSEYVETKYMQDNELVLYESLMKEYNNGG